MIMTFRKIKLAAAADERVIKDKGREKRKVGKKIPTKREGRKVRRRRRKGRHHWKGMTSNGEGENGVSADREKKRLDNDAITFINNLGICFGVCASEE